LYRAGSGSRHQGYREKKAVTPPPASQADVASRIDHLLLAPEWTSVEVGEGLQLARRLGAACAIVRPCDLDIAVRTLAGSEVRPGSVVGHPYGFQNTPTKIFETRDLLRRGARELDIVIAVSKLLSREFQYVQAELQQISDACREANAIMKVILDAGRLTEELKIIACRCCERVGSDFVVGESLEDLALLRKYLPEEIQVKMGAVATVDDAAAAIEAGATRLGATDTAAILEAWKARVAATT